MSDQVRTLLVSDKLDTCHPAIAEYAAEYAIWQVVRQRDAMAFIKTLTPGLVMIDLDTEGLDVPKIVRTIRLAGQEVVLVGICRGTMHLAPNQHRQFDRIITIEG